MNESEDGMREELDEDDDSVCDDEEEEQEDGRLEKSRSPTSSLM